MKPVDQLDLSDIDTLLLDCDGVLWHGTSLIPGISQTLDHLYHILRKRLVFITNNSTKSRRAYVKKFHAFGLVWVTEQMVFGSAYAAAFYLSRHLRFGSGTATGTAGSDSGTTAITESGSGGAGRDLRKVYVVGMSGICEELEDEGIAWTGAEHDRSLVMLENQWDTIPRAHHHQDHQDTPDDASNEVGAVVIGFDTYFSYYKLARAHEYLRYGHNVHFIATNTDLQFPTHSRLFPGTGCLVSALQSSVNRSPIVVGKPEQIMLDLVVEKFGLERSRTLMVGDRLDTDILFGVAGGVRTCLVMTGVTTPEERDAAAIRPEFWVESLVDLVRVKSG